MLKFGFYPYSNDKPNIYTEDDVGLLFDGLITDGAYRYVGDCFKVIPVDGQNKKVRVGSGQAWLNHTYSKNESGLILDLSEVTASTCDIVLTVNKVLAKNQIQIMEGDYESTPEISYNKIATVTMTGASQIVEADIVNYVGTEFFPYAKSLLIGDEFRYEMEIYVNGLADELRSEMTAEIAESSKILTSYTNLKVEEASKTLTSYTNIKIDEGIKTLTSYTNLQLEDATKTLTSFTNIKIDEGIKTLTSYTNQQVSEATKTLTSFTNIKVEEAVERLEKVQIDNDTIQRNESDQIYVPKLPGILTDIQNLQTDFSSFESAKGDIVSSALGQELGLTDTSTIAEVATAIDGYVPQQEPNLQEKSVDLYTSQYADGRIVITTPSVTPDEGYYGLSKVNVVNKIILLQLKTVTPSTSQQIVKADIGYYGLRQVTVNAATTGKPEWQNTSNGSYKFVQNGQRWIANNRGVASSTATSTWKVTVPSATTANIGYRVASESSYDKLTITFNGETIVSSISGSSSSESSKTINLVAGENTLTATYSKDGSADKNGDMAYVILPAIGDQPGQYKYQSKSVTPGSSSQTITPDNGYDGLYSVSVGAAPTSSSSSPYISLSGTEAQSFDDSNAIYAGRQYINHNTITTANTKLSKINHIIVFWNRRTSNTSTTSSTSALMWWSTLYEDVYYYTTTSNAGSGPAKRKIGDSGSAKITEITNSSNASYFKYTIGSGGSGVYTYAYWIAIGKK